LQDYVDYISLIVVITLIQNNRLFFAGTSHSKKSGSLQCESRFVLCSDVPDGRQLCDKIQRHHFVI
jgi:hypothetical protein